eukprot:SAG25_NODE_12249_length_284_cov_0.767568_1_plen_32_part_10
MQDRGEARKVAANEIRTRRDHSGAVVSECAVG